jgi:hypothetical protein
MVKNNRINNISLNCVTKNKTFFVSFYAVKKYKEYTKMSFSPFSDEETSSPEKDMPDSPSYKPSVKATFFDQPQNQKYIVKRFENDEWAYFPVNVLDTFHSNNGDFHVCELLYHGKKLTVHLRSEEVSDAVPSQQQQPEMTADEQQQMDIVDLPLQQSKEKYVVTGLRPTYQFHTLRNRHAGFLSKYLLQKTKRKN